MNKEILKLKKIIEELEQLRGRHTELISYYIPAKSEFSKIVDLIAQEQALTRNVKNKTVRKNVLSALEKINQELKVLGKIPEEGLAIFCGNISQEEGKPDIRIWSVIPPKPINIKLYWCDQKFKLEPLKELVREKDNYGIICLDKSEADIGVISGKNIEILKHLSSLVPGKTRAGGQSSVRFYRVRENLLNSFLQKVSENAREVFSKIDLKGIILSGPGPIKEKLYNESFLPSEIKSKVIGIVDVAYTGEQGIRETIEKGKDLIKESEITKELDLLKEFFVKLSKGGGEVTYGEDDVIDAIKNKNAEIVIISEDFKNKSYIENLCIENKIDFVYVSTSTQEGIQFLNIGGIGAILRY